MNVSLISSINKSTNRIKEILTLAIDALEKISFINIVHRKAVISKLRDCRFYSPEKNVVLSISFDAKTCKFPKGYCCGNCKGCYYNQLEGAFDAYLSESSIVITCQDMIDILLDVIELLVKPMKI